MAYKIVTQAEAWWPVHFKGVTEDGAIVENSFDGRFRILDEDENLQLERDIAQVSQDAGVSDTSLTGMILPFVQRILKDWRGVTEDDGTAVGASLPFAEASLKRMLVVPNVTAAIMAAYRAARAAEPEQRTGN